MKSHDLAIWLVNNGVEVTMQDGGDGRIAYSPNDGFYKSDWIASFSDQDGRIVLRTRYDGRCEIQEPMDLVRESKKWHELSKSRFAGWASPSDAWTALYLQLPT